MKHTLQEQLVPISQRLPQKMPECETTCKRKILTRASIWCIHWRKRRKHQLNWFYFLQWERFRIFFTLANLYLFPVHVMFFKAVNIKERITIKPKWQIFWTIPIVNSKTELIDVSSHEYCWHIPTKLKPLLSHFFCM